MESRGIKIKREFPTVFHTSIKVNSLGGSLAFCFGMTEEMLDGFSDAISGFALSLLLMSAQKAEKSSNFPWTSDPVTWTAEISFGWIDFEAVTWRGNPLVFP